MFSIFAPYPLFIDLDGNPLEDGYIYIGTAGLNPEVSPINIYWDSALTIPAEQPLRTINGHISRSGSPGIVYISADDCSFIAKNKNGTLIYSALNITKRISGSMIDGLTADDILFTQSGTGAIERTVSSILREHVSVTDFGAVGDGVTDDKTAIQNALDSGASIVYFPSGTYLVSDQLTVPSSVTIIGRSSADTVITAEGNTTGAFSDGGVVYKAGSIPTQIVDLSVSPSKGDIELSFTSAHSLSVGDLILIYNPTNGSWNSSRTYYRAGEYCKITEVISSTQVRLENALFDSYNIADVDVYECSSYGSGGIHNIKFIAPGAGTNGAINALRVEYCRDIQVSSIHASNSDNSSFSISKSYGGNISNSYCEQHGANPGYGTQYGIVIGNCQQIDISGTFIGNRHAISLGGGDTFSVTCRNIIVHDYIAKNETNSLVAANWHGNVEYCEYINGILNNGISIGGNNNRISGAKIVGYNVYACYAGEMKGFDHVVENIECYTTINDTSRGIIDVGGNSTAAGADTDLGGTLTFRNIFIEAPNHTNHGILVRNRGYSGDQYDIVVDNFEYRAPSTTTSDAAVRIDTVSGDAAGRIAAAGISLGPSTSAYKLALGSSELASSLIRQDSESGIAEIVTTTGVNIISSSVLFNSPFSKTPYITTAVSDMNTSGDRCLSEANNASVTGFDARYRRVDQIANFTGAVTRYIYWHASLNEW